MTEKYRIVQEVPGVPEDERWFVTGPDMPPTNHSTEEAAREFFHSHGIPDDCIKVEHFEL